MQPYFPDVGRSSHTIMNRPAAADSALSDRRYETVSYYDVTASILCDSGSGSYMKPVQDVSSDEECDYEKPDPYKDVNVTGMINQNANAEINKRVSSGVYANQSEIGIYQGVTVTSEINRKEYVNESELLAISKSVSDKFKSKTLSSGPMSNKGKPIPKPRNCCTLRANKSPARTFQPNPRGIIERKISF